ncbi:MAG: hypothetical protein PVJ49_01585 [Acidobacteriota bacterium]|jgi:hypothetical protein
MDQRTIDNALHRHIARLRSLAIAFCASAAMYVGIALILERVVGLGPLLEISFPVAAGIAVLQLLVILAGYLISRAVRAPRNARAAAARDAEEAMGRYTTSVIIASAMREVAAVIGFVLTLLTGDLMWVSLLAAVAVVSMLVHWPRRAAVRDFLEQQGALG